MVLDMGKFVEALIGLEESLEGPAGDTSRPGLWDHRGGSCRCGARWPIFPVPGGRGYSFKVMGVWKIDYLAEPWRTASSPFKVDVRSVEATLENARRAHAALLERVAKNTDIDTPEVAYGVAIIKDGGDIPLPIEFKDE